MYLNSFSLIDNTTFSSKLQSTCITTITFFSILNNDVETTKSKQNQLIANLLLVV